MLSLQNRLARNDKPVLDIIEELGYAKKKDILPLYAQAYQIDFVDLATYEIDLVNAALLLNDNICRKFGMIGLSVEDNVLTLGLRDPKNMFAIDSAQMLTFLDIKPVLVDEELLIEKLNEIYPPKQVVVEAPPAPTPEPEQEPEVEAEVISTSPSQTSTPSTPASEARSNTEAKVSTEPTGESRIDSIFREKIGQMLLDSGEITKKQLDKSLAIQNKNGGLLGNILVNEGYINKDKLFKHLEKQIGVRYVDLENTIISDEAIKITPSKIAHKRHVIPIEYESNVITVAMADPLNMFAIDDLRLATGCDIEVLLADIEVINKLLPEYYPIKEESPIEDVKSKTPPVNFIKEMAKVQEEISVEVQEVQTVESNINFNDVDNAPIVRMLNMIFKNAVDQGASDIHIEAYEDCVMVRFRVDGKLVEITRHDKKLHSILVARVKIISGLNIAERRIPQDGRITLKINNKNYDFRVSICPTVFGEKVVIRIADKEDFAKEKTQLGFTEEDLEKFNRMLARPNGIVLITGPTGSGKSTTLYSALRELCRPQVNILTVEDPVEATIRGINQVQVNVKAGMTFATALRSFLRQDPDIIMVGEIRDGETAEIAVRAAITGHLVLSTLHTNDSVSSINRLVDMNVEPFLIASSLVGVVAQRLVRRLCPHCKGEYKPNKRQASLLKLEDEDATIYRPVGCPQCNDFGYKGRIAIYEILEVSDELKELISLNATTQKMQEAALRNGLVTLHSSCARLVRSGITSMEEMLSTVTIME